MPTLDWIGKGAVAKHHQDVPYRRLEPVPEFDKIDSPALLGVDYKSHPKPAKEL